jgi:hypothetical protein
MTLRAKYRGAALIGCAVIILGALKSRLAAVLDTSHASSGTVIPLPAANWCSLRALLVATVNQSLGRFAEPFRNQIVCFLAK